ncbi:zinc finger protein 836-like [Haliotis cracherodii]|uniref:zinc finger protein 836-like n=1 Tax=Haliotis cracherodii TaxID=6455 RepID=UPI0039EC935B
MGPSLLDNVPELAAMNPDQGGFPPVSRSDHDLETVGHVSGVFGLGPQQDVDDNGTRKITEGNKIYFQCDVCGQLFTRSNDCQRHRAAAHDNRTCSNLQKIAGSVSFGHSFTGSSVQGIDGGGNSSGQSWAPAEHVFPFSSRGRRSVSMLDRQFSCDICGKEFTEIWGVKRHKQANHEDDKDHLLHTSLSTSMTCGSNRHLNLASGTSHNSGSASYPSFQMFINRALSTEGMTGQPVSSHGTAGHTLAHPLSRAGGLAGSGGPSAFSYRTSEVSKSKCCFCDICGKEFPDNWRVRRHKQAAHENITHPCVCGRLYKYKGDLLKHQKNCSMYSLSMT